MELRWSPHIFIDDKANDEFWKEHFDNKSHKLLFILGKGFDIRMNIALARLINNCPKLKITCLIVEFDEGTNSSSHKYQHIIDENMAELSQLINVENLASKKINIWNDSGREKRIAGDKNASRIINKYSDIKEYTDIIIDISSLPRGIYFSLVGKVLALIDSNPHQNHNLFLTVAENVEIDRLIQESALEEDLAYLHGFGGEIELESEKEKPLIWFPILGEEKQFHIRKGADKITEDKNRLYEICPVLPFPSKNPRRSDSLLIEYHELLFDFLDIEPQNIMYTSERDPFQAYIDLSSAIINYRQSLNIINGCKIAVSTFSSKLLSIGSLLVAYENRSFVGIMNVNSGGYEILDEDRFKELKNQSELFVTWLTGNPYKE